MELQEILDYYPEHEFLKMDGYDDCVVGLTDDMVLVYSREKIIKKLANEMSLDEAVEFFDFNIGCAYSGENTPLIITTELM